MKEASLVFVDTAGNGDVGEIQKVSLMEVMAKKRQRLSDITNTANHLQRNSRSRPGQENPNLAPLQHTKDYIAELLKENTALLRLLGEKNKIVEMNALELQKLRISFQQLQQQNCQLARTNTLMLEELNLGKDRVIFILLSVVFHGFMTDFVHAQLKALQHELGCTVAMLKTTKLEIENEVPSSTNEEDTVKQLNPAGKDGCNLKRKRASRRCSLGSAPLVRGASAKETNGNCGRRRSSRTCRKSEPCEEKEQQISELKVRTSKCEAKSLRKVDTAVDPSISRSPPIEELKVEEDGDLRDAPDPSKQELDRRSITGRPQRRSTAGVSYKEKSLRVKMRRS